MITLKISTALYRNKQSNGQMYMLPEVCPNMATVMYLPACSVVNFCFKQSCCIDV